MDSNSLDTTSCENRALAWAPCTFCIRKAFIFAGFRAPPGLSLLADDEEAYPTEARERQKIAEKARKEAGSERVKKTKVV